jgi:uncharacterized membrane protein
VTRLVVVWLHLLAAAVWLGGLVYASHLVVPRLAHGEGNYAALLARGRLVTWIAVALVVATGLWNLQHARWDSPWLMAKALLILALVPLAAHRDFGILPRVVRALDQGTSPASAVAGLRWLDRITTLGLVLVLFLGVGLARGR